MATAHAHQEHGHGGGHGADHHPHVLPLSVYLGVFATLIVFTVITVAVSRIDLGPANLVVALVVATMKAMMVAFVFMHLAFDKKFNTLVFASALIFLAIFIGFTLFDTGWRNLGGRTSGDSPVSLANPFEKDGTKSAAALRAKYEKKPAHGEAAPHDAKEQKSPPSPASPEPGVSPGAATNPAPATQDAHH